ncbi:glycosyltransferase [Desulfolutivibrio sp.]|uniref:glycosyltransferase n=1 Tax=Desulfolutivibrio sp. TaxID=2773296 RepID=UPI002F964FB6
MTALFVGAMALILAGLATLVVLGRNHVRGVPGSGPRPDVFPRAALVVPVTGDAPGVREALATLVRQDYPGLIVVFATATDDDPAVPLVEGLIGEGSGRVFRVTAGLATRCGQKNHNLLAGVAFLQGLRQRPDIYLFGDSTHLARPDFAATLAAPLTRGEAVLASGFHRVEPLSDAPGVVGMFVTCLALHMLQSIRAVTQPWGGAMALTREAFERFGVAGLWAESIVDDCSMAAMLRKKGVVCRPVAGAAVLSTPLAAMSLSRWSDWLTRQLLYLKFCMPGTWLPAIPAALALSLVPVAAGLVLLGGLAGLFPAGLTLASAAFVAGLAGLGLFFRGLSPRPIPRAAFLAGFAMVFPMVGWCMGRTLFTRTMVWRDIAYEVSFSGRVRRIIRKG